MDGPAELALVRGVLMNFTFPATSSGQSITAAARIFSLESSMGKRGLLSYVRALCLSRGTSFSSALQDAKET